MAIELKGARGKALIKKLSCPQKPTIKLPYKKLTPAIVPELFGEFYQYNVQDIIAEGSVSAVVPDLSPHELKVWQLDQQINVRGVQIDAKALNDCLVIVRKTTDLYAGDLVKITGIRGITIDSLQKIRAWMELQGVSTQSLDSDHVDELLLRKDIPKKVREVLEIRQILGSASVKKLYAMERYLCSDGRIRGLYLYCGARQTGRFAGRGPQPQNIPAGGPDVVVCSECSAPYWKGLVDHMCPHCWGTGSTPGEWGIDSAKIALKDISSHDIDYVSKLWGNPIKAVSGCLRALFIAGPGKDLICSDYTAIEAVVLAVLAGEEWRIEVFRTHGKIYEMSVHKLSGIPFEEVLEYKKVHGVHHPLRKKLGKVSELASGYAGWIGAWLNFGAGDFMTEEEIKKGILKWREESPMIVELWGGQWRKHPTKWQFTPELFGVEGAVVMAIKNPGLWYRYRLVAYGVHNNILYCKLPSGRHLVYHKPHLVSGTAPFGKPILNIKFEGWNSDTTKGPKGWMVRDTYGGRLVENFTQAIARDIFVQGMLNLDNAGYDVVLHSHDEPVMEVPRGFGTVDDIERLMCTPADWYKGWPIKAAGGWRGLRYRK